MLPYEYLVLEAIPEIDARPGDVLVWNYPVVALVRRSRVRPTLSTIRMHEAHWWFVFSKYEDRLTPYASDCPPVLSLLDIAVGAESPRPAPRRARHLRVEK